MQPGFAYPTTPDQNSAAARGGRSRRANVVKKGPGATGPQRKEIDLARIAGVNIPTHKRVPIALTYITGIGPTTAKAICEAVNIDASRRVNELSDAEVLAIREQIDANYMVEGDLRRETQMNIKRLMDLGCYRGLRHRRSLPVRGRAPSPHPGVPH